MPKSIDKELEQAILTLPVKEKDKMLLRLIAKNKILVEQLHYKLLEDPVLDLQFRFDNAKDLIKDYSKSPTANKINVLMQNLRIASAQITHFKKITGDKLGEIKLIIFFLVMFYDKNQYFFLHSDYNYYWEKLFVYFIKKLSSVLKMIDKVHEDYFIEFESDLNYLLENVHKGNLRTFAVQFEVPKYIEI
jgi:hypothetical protein